MRFNTPTITTIREGRIINGNLVYFDEDGIDMIPIRGFYNKDKLEKIVKAEMDFLDGKKKKEGAKE